MESYNLIKHLSNIPIINKQLEMDSGVIEDYTLKEHTLMVLRQFDKYYQHQFPMYDIEVSTFRWMLALHDIGKAEASKNRERHRQHSYSIKKINDYYDSGIIDMSEDDRYFIVNIISGDPIGDCMKEDILPYEAATKIYKMSKKVGIDIDKFMKLLKIYYLCDASSYTRDAGPHDTLGFMFDFTNNNIELKGKYREIMAQIDNKLKTLQIFLQ